MKKIHWRIIKKDNHNEILIDEEFPSLKKLQEKYHIPFWVAVYQQKGNYKHYNTKYSDYKIEKIIVS